ncbi:MAG TPA: hypothetical protein VGN11_01795 [Candidatus Baltobacteraceae bacterium]|nr:hypothetical protein [Candidatus Baltobacteraceae bacterium]
MMIKVRALVLTALLLPCIAPSAASARVLIPFQRVDDGLIQVRASLDGNAPVPMLVDIGAGIDILGAKTADSLRSARTGRYTSWRMEGERLDVPTGSIASIGLGAFRVENPTIATWNGLDGSGIDGLISATAFRETPVTFDFPDNELVVEDAASLAVRKKTAVRVPLALQDDRGISLGVFARFDFGNGQSGLCEIDTGSQGFVLDKHYAVALGVDRVGGAIPSLTLHGAPATTIAKPPVVFSDLIFDCNVGNDFWANKQFSLDIPDRALFVPRQ